jgi:hypothetical protein
MIKIRRPYLVIPKLIEQPTWGGKYILDMKNWSAIKDFTGKKIGQSYELFSGSKLLLNINASTDSRFVGELGSPDEPTVFNKTGYEKDVDYVNLADVTDMVEKIPLIKLNQSNGNSFQLHIKKGVPDNRWLPKPETWYYFEDGLVTYGIKKGIDLEDYKNACKKIETEMKKLSVEVINKNLSLSDAKLKANTLVKEINPWQFVNTHVVKKHSVVDPSLGGIHHSWEEDLENYPLGNVLYEIQKDVMDPVCTIRSFDKGKIKSDGSIREINVSDYFKYLDTDPSHNDIAKMTPNREGNSLIKTPDYSLDILELDNEFEDKTDGTFVHLFVRDGAVEVSTSDGRVLVAAGHSCFIGENVLTYSIKPVNKRAVLLKAYVGRQ